LRVVETREFRRLGGDRAQRFSARVISATNRPVTEQVGVNLRPDFYFRLAGYTLTTAPLAHRLEDIPLLAEYFARQLQASPAIAADVIGAPPAIEADAMALLQGHAWPGNVRELRAVVRNAVVLGGGDTVRREDVEAALRTRPVPSRPGYLAAGVTALAPYREALPPTLRVGSDRAVEVHASLPDLERRLILKAYADCAGNVTRAARALGIPRSTFRDRLRRLGVD
jgi:two-component system, NtrC family, response regulator AtoC